MFAALAVCLTQAIGKNVGFLNTVLYSNTGWYRDILSGNNGTYTARTGYDCCTGMGVPIGTKLLAALKTVVPPTPTPVPNPTPVPTTTTHTIVITGTGTVITIDGKTVI